MLELRIARIPVSIGWDFLLGAGLLGLSRISQPVLLFEWVLVVAGSILIHELGHALAFRVFGCSSRIRFHSMGGETAATGAQRLTHTQHALVSLAGPAAGLLLGGAVVASGIEPSSFLGNVVVRDLIWVNIGWSLINLLPMLPMDGGQILESVLARSRGAARAKSIALLVTIAIAAVAAPAAILYWRAPFAAVLAAWFGIQAYQELQALRAR